MSNLVEQVKRIYGKKQTLDEGKTMSEIKNLSKELKKETLNGMKLRDSIKKLEKSLDVFMDKPNMTPKDQKEMRSILNKISPLEDKLSASIKAKNSLFDKLAKALK